MTRNAANDFLSRIPFGFLSMGGKELEEYNHPTLAKFDKALENYINQGQTVQQPNYIQKQKPNYIQKQNQGAYNKMSSKAYQQALANLPPPPPMPTESRPVEASGVSAIMLNQVIPQQQPQQPQQQPQQQQQSQSRPQPQQQSIPRQAQEINPYQAQIDKLEQDPMYMQAIKDPFSTNQGFQNKLSEMSGLQIQRKQAEQPTSQNPYEKQVNDLISKMPDMVKNPNWRAEGEPYWLPNTQKIQALQGLQSGYNTQQEKSVSSAFEKQKYQDTLDLQKNAEKAKEMQGIAKIGEHYLDTKSGAVFDSQGNQILEPSSVLAAREKAGGAAQLKPNVIKDITSVASASDTMDALMSMVNQNKDKFGVVAGRLNSMNYFDKDAQLLKSRLSNEAYTAWRQIDPRLSDQDAARALEQVGDLATPFEIVLDRLAYLKNKANAKNAAYIKALASQGYDVSELSSNSEELQGISNTNNNSEPNIPEGTVQRNKRTGQTRIMRNGQWQIQ